ncbi:hypothetical protein V22_05080 [Calycomorphotria hydatis]|uniref:Uncharacterized protein n=1 Tax=Calycomorphotria hydatis TaxID=2528027 RepID=A0A517T4J4_9PLAN|nr:hypothetical protein V22_05080 [Calycomorphotria hydatis]
MCYWGFRNSCKNAGFQSHVIPAKAGIHFERCATSRRDPHRHLSREMSQDNVPRPLPLQHPHKRQMPILVVVIQPISHDEFIRDFEAAVVGGAVDFATGGFP